jgi:hypothetical protein
MVATFVEAASLLLVLAFALALGAQLFDTAVNVPVFFSDPPASVNEFLKHPIGRRVPAYFARLIVLTIAATLIALVACVAASGPAALVVAAACAVLYLALVFLFFIPANRKLGFLPPAAGATPAAPQAIARLVQHWRMWNVVRIVLQFAGLIAAVLAFAAAMK